MLTGRRSEAWLGPGASDLLTSYLTLPDEMREALAGMARSLSGQFQGPSASTVHAPRSAYRARRP